MSRLLIYVISILSFTTILQVNSEENQPKDKFAWKKQKGKDANPTYQTSATRGYGGDLYQPYYVCDDYNSLSGMPLSAWHYSCKQSCTEHNARQLVNMTTVKWNYKGPEVDVYKVVTHKVCYTSHVNVWNYCSQTQTVTPVATVESDRSNLPGGLFSASGPKHQGTMNIVRSKEAPCDYFSDNTLCERDYIVSHRVGKTTQKHDGGPIELTVYQDGIRADPYGGFLTLEDVSWFWAPPSKEATQECGWEKSTPIQCSFTDSGETLKCDDIGYTYNIQSLEVKKTCIGDIYDIDGPAPFMHDKWAYIESRDEITQKALAGKGDADVNFIRGLNMALTEIESTYCSAVCDIFARKNDDDDHVLDTPIGNWRVSNKDTLYPRLIPCQPSSNWTVRNPTTICHGSNNILVEEITTGHTNSWNPSKDYIIAGELCSSKAEEFAEDDSTFKDKIAKGETINITFWTGDILSLKPPYDKPIWCNMSKRYRQNPSWFSKVKIVKDYIHSQTDISLLLTRAVKNLTVDLAYNKTSSKSIKHFLIDEVYTGIENVVSNTWIAITNVFGGVTKVLMFGLIVLGILVGLKVLNLLVPLYHIIQSVRPKSKGRRVMFEDVPMRDPSSEEGKLQLIRRPRSRSRNRRQELANMLSAS